MTKIDQTTQPPQTSNQFTWRAQPKQQVFLAQQTIEAFYGGAAGGGKSDALLLFSIARRLKYAGSKGLLLRRTIEELRKEGSLIPRSHELLHGKWRWIGSEKKWIAPNKSVLEFGYCKYEKDVYQYQSAQYDDLCIDELTHWTEFQYRYMKTRVRSARGVPVAIRAASNPGNVGHQWVKQRFVTIAPPGTVYVDPKDFYFDPALNKNMPIDRVYIPARIYDNKILMEQDPGYEARLNDLPEHERRALKEGDWDVFKGQYFYEWRYDLHVTKPFKIPDDWNIYLCMDWGFAAPSAIYAIAVSPLGRAYVFKELYITSLNASQLAARICEHFAPELKKCTFFVADPSIFAKRGEAPESIGQTINKLFQQYGYRQITGSKNERVNGWMRFREWLSLAPDGLPWMQFFETCHYAITTIPALIFDERWPEDLNTDSEDHSADALRYFSVNRTNKAKIVQAKPYDSLPLKDQARWERWERGNKPEKTGVLDMI